MSIAQLRRTLADGKWMVTWFVIGLVGYGVIIAAMWPTMKESQQVYEQMLKAWPEAMLKAFGITGMAHFTGFVGTEYLNLMWPIITSVFLIMTASAFVAGEIDRGTVELWLSVPDERWHLLASKLAAFLLQIVILAVASIVSLAIAAGIAGERLETDRLAATTVVLLSFGVVVGGYTALFSSLFSSRGAAAGLAAAVTFASYLAGVVAGINPDLERLKYLSLLTAFHPQAALEGDDPVSEILVLAGIGLACALASLVVFQRRDANP